tara:strand:+ start:1565 stop:1999 length:435 start_codon:yes stop_codon:yes gene_type:complete
MYKNTGFINSYFKKYIDDLYNVIYMSRLYKKKIYIILTKNKPKYLKETNYGYIQFIMYINKNNIKKLYNFIKLHFPIQLFNNLTNILQINKFENNKNYGLLTYICDTKNILQNTNGGFIIINNNNINIDIIENNKELFSTSYYF